MIEPKKIKKGKYSWKNWKQEQVDGFRHEYASFVLFDEINQLRDKAITESEIIRVFKPSSAILNPFCRFSSRDIESQ
ncbi:hypothetical protein Ahy_A07g034398 [Arachis hypogaea]|uniref:Uncharacterized protein n=1 Tax=Arachis hypogaea TaxID=3818 RepID=A0A445CBS9_ARAHY|nr:hypothetical protein Ahy_A07g034398 [Arachis hypogaea]